VPTKSAFTRDVDETAAKAKGEADMLNIKVVSWSLGIFTAVSFVLCVIYGLIVPANLHMAPFLEMALPAFKWLTFWGFCLGLIESFLYGAYAGLVFVPIYNFLARRWGAPTGVQSKQT
jgi:hypothetical protein